MLVSVAHGRGDVAGADAYLREAVPLAERSGDARTRIQLLRARASVADSRGRQAESLADLRQAVDIADRSGDAALRVDTRSAASAMLLGQSRYDEALALAQTGYEISQQQTSPRVRGSGIFQLAQANNHVWNLDVRRAVARGPRRISSGRQRGGAVAMQSVNTWFALGEFERAVTEGEKAVALLKAANG